MSRPTAFSASLVARIAYDAGCISRTNTDSPGSAIEPSLFRLTRNACWLSMRLMMVLASTCGGGASGGVGVEVLEHRSGCGADGVAGAVELEVAELPLHDQHPRRDAGVLERDVG